MVVFLNKCSAQARSAEYQKREKCRECCPGKQSCVISSSTTCALHDRALVNETLWLNIFDKHLPAASTWILKPIIDVAVKDYEIHCTVCSLRADGATILAIHYWTKFSPRVRQLSNNIFITSSKYMATQYIFYYYTSTMTAELITKINIILKLAALTGFKVFSCQIPWKSVQRFSYASVTYVHSLSIRYVCLKLCTL